MIGITSYGAYIPRLRLQRKAVAQANAWFAPNMMGAARGERSMANWDEDAVTMSVEAARDCIPAQDPIKDRAFVDGLYFASTTMPFSDRQNAGIVAGALSLGSGITSLDISSSQRAGTSALLAALDGVASGRVKAPLVVAGEKRKARAASSQELAYGDAAAAFTLGKDKVIAKFLGSHSVTLDFVDHFRGGDEDYDYGWEERWIRDEGYSKIVPAAIKTLLEKSGVSGGDIAHLILPCPFAKLDQALAKQSGIDPAKVRDNLSSNVGDTGAAHALLMLAHALESAKPGDKILIAQFGQGCDVLLFEMTPEISSIKRRGVSGSLARRKEETNYNKYLGFNGLIELEKGMRAEVDKRTALTVLYRKNDMITGLVGGKCRVCGTGQFPRTRICVNPNCKAVDSQDPYSFADQQGTILSWSADFLTYSMSPPNHYGMITFADGGRFMADITDVDQGQIDSGTKVKMVFRMKDRDEKRGFIRYFWKGGPRMNDEEAIGRVIDAMYAMVSGPKGPRDWSRQRDVFHQDARQMRTGLDANGKPWIKIMGLNDYSSDTRDFFAQNDFFEVEIGRRIRVFGNIADAWSLYEARTAPDDTNPERRGINAIQFYRGEDGRWRIMSMIWDNERPGLKLPDLD